MCRIIAKVKMATEVFVMEEEKGGKEKERHVSEREGKKYKEVREYMYRDPAVIKMGMEVLMRI